MTGRETDAFNKFFDQLLREGHSSEQLETDSLSSDMKWLGEKLNRLNENLNEFMDCAGRLAEGKLNAARIPGDNPFCRYLHEMWEAWLCDSRRQEKEAIWREAYLRVKEEESFLRRLTCQDPVTELYNRRYCLQKMEEWEVQQCAYSFCFLDLDHLKEVNDSFGHCEGDYYIKTLARVLQNGFRQTDMVCRVGGDEFVVLMKECPKKLAEDRLKSANTAFAAEGTKHGRYPMNFSYGVEYVTKGEKRNACEIMEAADKAMYRYKRRYNGCRP